MSTCPHLSDHVAWTYSDMPAWRRGLRLLPLLVGLVLDAATAGGGTPLRLEPVDPKFGSDPQVVLGTVSVRGRGAGMPTSYRGPQLVTIYRSRATIQPGQAELELPLAMLTVRSAKRVGMRWTRRKDMDARWAIRAVAPQVDLTFRGGWLLLAYLGTLGGWSEPA